MQRITHKGDTPPVIPNLQVPKWGGGETKDSFQPWHANQFSDAAQAGVELIYPYEDVDVEPGSCPPPFQRLSEHLYQLKLDTVLTTPHGYSLLVVPHYRYYTDPEWSTPLPLFCSWGTDWWPRPLTVMFRYGPKTTLFRKGEPFAQAIVVEREETTVTEMGDSEEERIRQIDGEADKYITRKWETADGTQVDNVYNALANLHRRERYPFDVRKTRKFRMIGRNKC